MAIQVKSTKAIKPITTKKYTLSKLLILEEFQKIISNL